MPTYEYRCEKCGEQFEVFQSFSDRALRRHPDCGGPLEKVLHPRGIVFKGSGFYVTDSRSRSSSSSDLGESNGSSSDKVSADSSKSGDKSGSGDKAPSRDKASSGDRAPSGDKSGAGDKPRDKSKSSKKSSGDRSSTSSGNRD
jgi:putative FmdB family regulatory protein